MLTRHAKLLLDQVAVSEDKGERVVATLLLGSAPRLSEFHARQKELLKEVAVLVALGCGVLIVDIVHDRLDESVR